jgi:O-antigen ligase
MSEEGIEMRSLFPSIGRSSRSIKLAGLCAASLAAVLVAVHVNPENLKLVSIACLAAILVLGVVLHTGQFRRVVLFLFVISQGYFRTYSLTGHYVLLTTYDGYWTPCDPLLLILVGIAVWQRVFERRPATPRPNFLWLWWLPFLLMTAISCANAINMNWAVFEVWRQTKVLVILLILPTLIRDRKDWFVLLAALGASISGQALLGVAQLFLGGGVELAGESTLRANGTLGHPNQLSSYIELIWPVFGMLILAPRGILGKWNSWLRRAAAFVSVSALMGIAAAQSRAVWFTASLQIAAILCSYILLRRANFKRVVGSAVLAVFLAGAVAIPFSSRIASRFEGNLQESVDFREKFDEVAILMYLDHPVIGGGPRQFPLYFARRKAALYGPVANLIPDFPVHNLYLLYLDEFGAFGFVAFLVFIAGMFGNYLIAYRRCGTFGRMVILGFTFGFVAMLIHQMSEFVLTLDPNLFTWPIIMCLATSSILYRIREEEEPPKAAQGVKRDRLVEASR